MNTILLIIVLLLFIVSIIAITVKNKKKLEVKSPEPIQKKEGAKKQINKRYFKYQNFKGTYRKVPVIQN